MEDANPELKRSVMNLAKRGEEDGKGGDEALLQNSIYCWRALPYTIRDAGARAAPRIWA